MASDAHADAEYAWFAQSAEAFRKAREEAWDEGEQAGRDNADDGYPDPIVVNPYRAKEVDHPAVLNPGAIGNPDETPVVDLSSDVAAYFERTRCPECRRINNLHADDCAQGVPRG